MPPTAPKTNIINVFARWRRLTQPEAAEGTIDYSTSSTDSHGLLSVSISGGDSGSGQSWTSPPAFNAIFNTEDNNGEVYKSIVAPAIPHVLRGGSCNFFAYGHSGSGKTHTIIGYDYDDERELGLCLAAARQLFEVIDDLNANNAGEKLGIGFSLFEMRKKSAFDLLNRRTECHSESVRLSSGPAGATILSDGS
ncbi:hypothetical protein TgHK011_003261 [Trichoderma gracile]|nr:hypothetical protein TgHK011_003261 [Trichoderma gracile]